MVEMPRTKQVRFSEVALFRRLQSKKSPHTNTYIHTICIDLTNTPNLDGDLESVWIHQHHHRHFLSVLLFSFNFYCNPFWPRRLCACANCYYIPQDTLDRTLLLVRQIPTVPMRSSFFFCSNQPRDDLCPSAGPGLSVCDLLCCESCETSTRFGMGGLETVRRRRVVAVRRKG